MQSGREDSLEERYAIKLCFKLGKNATETYGMLHTAFGPDQKERRCHDSREMVELINSDPAVLDALVTYDKSWIYCYDPDTKRQISQTEQIYPQTFDDPFF